MSIKCISIHSQPGMQVYKAWHSSVVCLRPVLLHTGTMVVAWFWNGNIRCSLVTAGLRKLLWSICVWNWRHIVDIPFLINDIIAYQLGRIFHNISLMQSNSVMMELIGRNW
ncbi:hypothetical protein M758_1G099200 [Ceratodon purpureus]|nr:hypothetical protein M758_1G099200 [Ceratodon purpureus]